jgi:hypothetical protein
MGTEFKVANLESFLRSVKDAQKQCADLSVPFTQIGQDWMRSNKTIFSYSGAGPWADLSGGRARHDSKGRYQSPDGGYKAQKLKKWGFVYPILKASGELERSLTVPGDPNSLFVVKPTGIEIGTKVVSKDGAPYPAFLAHGTRTMPARNYLTIPAISVMRWKQILQTFIVGKLTAPGGATTQGN